MKMKQLTHLIPTWQQSSKPLLGLLIMFSAWGNSNQAFAATVDVAIPQSSLFDVISARAKKLASRRICCT